jgi:small nuclear ribonucleoprotein (snRNP)-like protein
MCIGYLTAVFCRINEEVIIRLKWGQTEYKGRLISVDSYMNIQLSNTEEYIDRKHTGTLGQVLIRYGKSRISVARKTLTAR